MAVAVQVLLQLGLDNQAVLAVVVLDKDQQVFLVDQVLQVKVMLAEMGALTGEEAVAVELVQLVLMVPQAVQQVQEVQD